MRATQYPSPQTSDQINLLDIPVPGLYDFDAQLETQQLDDFEILRRREFRLVQAIAQASKVIQQVTETSGDLFDVVHYACGPSYLHFRSRGRARALGFGHPRQIQRRSFVLDVDTFWHCACNALSRGAREP